MMNIYIWDIYIYIYEIYIYHLPVYVIDTPQKLFQMMIHNWNSHINVARLGLME